MLSRDLNGFYFMLQMILMFNDHLKVLSTFLVSFAFFLTVFQFILKKKYLFMSFVYSNFILQWRPCHF